MPFDASVRAYLRAYQNEYRAALHGGQHTAELSFRVPMHEMFRRIAHDLNPAGTFDIILEPRNQGRMGRPDWRIQDRISLGVYGYIEAKGPSNEPFDTTPYRDQINRYLTLGHTITTRTVGTGFAEIGESVLTETTQTAIVFKPQMHEGGIRGSIIRYKKGRNGDRETPVPVDFRRLNAGDGIEIELNTEAVTNLTQRIQEIQALLDEEGVRPGIHRYRVTNVNDLVITDQNKARIIQRLLEANLGEDIWNQLVQDNPNIATRLANAKIQEDRLAVLHRFEEMLQDNTLAENNWQDFFEENTWIFGYGLRYQILRVIQPQPNYGGVAVDGRGGQRGDFLTATEAETRFTCLVEIKKTTTPLLQREQYRNGVWGASNELTGAVSQIQVNCAQWETDARTERNREQLPRIYTVSPKGIVVIGKTSELNNWDKRNSFERFRQELRCPEVLTYDELYERAKFIAEGPAPLDEDTDFDMPF